MESWNGWHYTTVICQSLYPSHSSPQSSSSSSSSVSCAAAVHVLPSRRRRRRLLISLSVVARLRPRHPRRRPHTCLVPRRPRPAASTSTRAASLPLEDWTVVSWSGPVLRQPAGRRQLPHTAWSVSVQWRRRLHDNHSCPLDPPRGIRTFGIASTTSAEFHRHFTSSNNIIIIIRILITRAMSEYDRI